MCMQLQLSQKAIPSYQAYQCAIKGTACQRQYLFVSWYFVRNVDSYEIVKIFDLIRNRTESIYINRVSYIQDSYKILQLFP